jgi:hypothetical protein
MLGCSVPQGMCAPSAGDDVYSCETITDDLAERLSANRSNGRMRCEEEAAPETGRTDFPYIAQNGIAVVVEQWPSQDGHYPVAAYQAAFGLCLALQAATLVWFAIPWLRTLGKHLYFLFAPPPAERDSQVALVKAPLDGAVLEASERMEW